MQFADIPDPVAGPGDVLVQVDACGVNHSDLDSRAGPLERGDDLLAMAAGQCAVSTAWHMVNRLALVRPGDLVLVPSASGGVAGTLVQCAKLAGATVVATAGTAAKGAQVSSLGADEVVVRGETDIASDLLRVTDGRRFDAVLDTVGGPLFETHLSVLREEGTLVICGAHAGEVVPVDLIPVFRNGWRIIRVRLAPTA